MSFANDAPAFVPPKSPPSLPHRAWWAWLFTLLTGGLLGCQGDKLPPVAPALWTSAAADTTAPAGEFHTTADAQADELLAQVVKKLQIPAHIKVQRVPHGRTAYAKGTISLLHDDFQRCLQAGPQAELALALLLGHELYHAYRQQAGAYGTGNAHPCDPTDELNADVFGVFYAWLYADLPVKAHTASVIERLLAGSFHSDCHPDPRQRTQAARLAIDKTQQLIQLYDQAALTLAMPWSNESIAPALEALHQLNSLLPQLPELMNNLAAAHIRQVLNEESSQGTFAYAFPLELDYAFRLKVEKPKSGAKDLSHRQRQWLSEAQKLLDQVLQLRPGHPQATLNRTSIQLIREELRQLPDAPALGAAWQVLQAICWAQNGQEARAKDQLQRLATSTQLTADIRQLAAINLAKLAGMPYPENWPDPAPPELRLDELYDELDAYRVKLAGKAPFEFAYEPRPRQPGLMGGMQQQGQVIKMLRSSADPLPPGARVLRCQRAQIPYLFVQRRPGKGPYELILLARDNI